MVLRRSNFPLACMGNFEYLIPHSACFFPILFLSTCPSYRRQVLSFVFFLYSVVAPFVFLGFFGILPISGVCIPRNVNLFSDCFYVCLLLWSNLCFHCCCGWRRCGISVELLSCCRWLVFSFSPSIFPCIWSYGFFYLKRFDLFFSMIFHSYSCFYYPQRGYLLSQDFEMYWYTALVVGQWCHIYGKKHVFNSYATSWLCWLILMKGVKGFLISILIHTRANLPLVTSLACISIFMGLPMPLDILNNASMLKYSMGKSKNWAHMNIFCRLN